MAAATQITPHELVQSSRIALKALSRAKIDDDGRQKAFEQLQANVHELLKLPYGLASISFRTGAPMLFSPIPYPPSHPREPCGNIGTRSLTR
jgi:hypothetical protein